MKIIITTNSDFLKIFEQINKKFQILFIYYYQFILISYYESIFIYNWLKYNNENNLIK